MITERQIKTYRNTQEKFKKRAYELLKEYLDLSFDERFEVDNFYFYADNIVVNYTLFDEYDVPYRKDRFDTRISDFCDEGFTLGEVRKWH